MDSLTGKSVLQIFCFLRIDLELIAVIFVRDVSITSRVMHTRDDQDSSSHPIPSYVIHVGEEFMNIPYDIGPRGVSYQIESAAPVSVAFSCLSSL